MRARESEEEKLSEEWEKSFRLTIEGIINKLLEFLSTSNEIQSKVHKLCTQLSVTET